MRSAIVLLLSFLVAGLTFSFSHAASKEVVSIPHTHLKKSLKALVILPKDYTSTDNKYSVIYFLHSYSTTYETWSDLVTIDSYADRYKLIFVCPDGNFNSWYIDSPVKHKSKFGTYIVKDVVGYVDKHYRTISEYKGRALIGSSMGGHGALTLLAKHPEVFRGAGSISGIMDLTEFPDEWDLSKVLGPYDKNRDLWKEHSFISLYANLIVKDRGIILDCGTSDFALPGNRVAHALLLQNEIPHEYYERPGEHDWRYVKNNVEYHILYLSRLLKPPTR